MAGANALAGTAWEVAEPCFAASQAFFLTTRGSPFSVTHSLIVCLRCIGMVEESEAENDIPT